MASNNLTPKSVASGSKAGSEKAQAQVQDAIDQLFALLQIAYQGQFEHRYKDPQILKTTKHLWYQHLSDLSPQQILQGAHISVRKSKYLPSIAEFITNCRDQDQMPDEAAWHLALDLATSRGQIVPPDTPASVYHAARSTGWDALLELGAEKSQKLFQYYYQQMLKRLAEGENLDIPQPAAIEKPKPLSKAESLKRLGKLRDTLKT